MRTCPSCSQPNVESANFCQGCGTHLASSSGRGDTRKVVTILFVDMVGSTGIGERFDPEALGRIQALYFSALTAAIEAHGGTVEKYIGDAVMAVFGIPRLHEDDALRAVRAGAAMPVAIETLSETLERDHGIRIAVRIGINTGEVLAGDPTAGQRLVTGDAVNIAARLEQAAAPGEILIGKPTYQLIRDAVEVEPTDALELRGKARPVAAYRLRSVLAYIPGHARNLESPLIGRTRELALIRRQLDRAPSERTSYLFTLLGAAGIGKSRLVREFLDGVGDATVLRGRCLSYGEGITYHALAEIVRGAVGIVEMDDSATAMAGLATVLSGADDDGRIARLVGGMFGWADPSAAEDAFWAIRKLFEHLAREQPVVVVIDDVHWAEPLLLDLIEYLADSARDARLLILCIARPELLEVRPGWGGGRLNATFVLLEPLADDDAGDLLANLLGGANLPSGARERILAAAEGNPLFVEEMLGMLIDDGLLRRDESGWRADSDLADLSVPPTIHLLLAARLDRLEAEERAVIERGAVEGKVFHSGAITSLTAEGLRPQVRSSLLALARKELIHPDRAEFAGEDAFRFRHMLIRDAAYQATPKEQRAELHERFARWLTQVAGDRLYEYREILGHHLERAYRYRAELGPIDERARSLALEAGQALRASGEHAQSHGDNAATTRLLERAVHLLDGFERAEASLELGEHLVWTDEHAQALPILRGFLRSADPRAWPALRIRAQVFLTLAESAVDPSQSQEASRHTTRELLVEAEALGDEQAIIACLLGVGQWASWSGRTSEQREVSERLLPRVNGLRAIYRDWVALGFRVDAYWGSTPVDVGLRNLEISRRIIGDSVIAGLSCDVVAFALLVMADRRTEADAVRLRIQDMRAAGVAGQNIGIGQLFGETLWHLDQHVEAIDAFLEEKAYLEARGETGGNSTTTARLAVCLGQARRFDEAQAMIDEARTMAAVDDFATWAEIGRATAMVSLGVGDVAAALDAVDPEIERLRPTDYLNLLADSIRLRGEILVAAKRPTSAAESFAEAMALYDRKGNIAGVRRLREWQAKHGFTS